MKIAIYGKSFDDSTIPFVQELFRLLEDRQAQLLVYERFIPY